MNISYYINIPDICYTCKIPLQIFSDFRGCHKCDYIFCIYPFKYCRFTYANTIFCINFTSNIFVYSSCPNIENKIKLTDIISCIERDYPYGVDKILENIIFL